MKDGSWVHDMTDRKSGDPLPLRADTVPVSLSEDEVVSTPGKSVRDVGSVGGHPNSPFSTGYSQSTSMSDVEEVDEHGIAKRKPFLADRYLLNRMSKTIVREQVPPSTQVESASSGYVAPAAKEKPILVPGVKAFAKSKNCPTAEGSYQ